MNLGVTYRKKLHEVVYKELRAKVSFISLPPHLHSYSQARAIFKSYRRLSRKRGMPARQELKT